MSSRTIESAFELWRARGDAAALSDVFDALAPGLLRLAIHLVGDPAAAEDLVQQTFVTAIERAARWDSGRALEPWLQGILTNHARDLRRSARRAHDPDFDLERVLAREEESPVDVASRRELSGEIARAVDALDEPYRAAVLLRLRHGLDAADIAHVLGRSPGAVRVQLHRAREMLRRSLPAGVASALVVLADSARGLASVRNQIVQHAASITPAASTSVVVVGGTVVVKKLVLALAIVAVVLAVSIASSRDDAIGPRIPGSTTSVETVAAHERDVVEAPSKTPTRSPEAVAGESTNASQTLRGIVLDADTDRPIAGARIALYRPTAMSAREIRARYGDRLTVGDRGLRQFRPWPHHETARDGSRVVPEFSPAQAVGIETVLVHAPPAAGTTPYAETTSDAQGRFELSADSTNAFLTCDAEGRAQRAFATGADRFGVDANADRTIYLSRDRVLRGRIVDEGRRPIRESVALSLYGHAPKQLRGPQDPALDPQDRRTSFRTDAEGRFAVETDARIGFVRSLDGRWFVRHHGYVAADGVGVRRTPWFDLVDETGELELELQSVASILVRDAQTLAPIEDAHVTLFDSATKIARRIGWYRLAEGRFTLPPAFAVEDPDVDGFGDLHADASVHVWSPGYAAVVVDVGDVLRPAEHVIELAASDAPELRGRVRRKSIPADGARVFVFPAAGGSPVRRPDEVPYAGAVCAADGSFALDVPHGRHVIVVDHDGSTLNRPVDVPHAGVLDVDLDASADLDVALVRADGSASGARDVRVRTGPGMEARTTTDGKGRARFEGLAVGRHDLAVSREAGAPFDPYVWQPVELVAGANAVTVVVPGGASMHARLVVEDGTVDGWSVRRSFRDASSRPVEANGRIPMDFAENRHFALVSPTGFVHTVTMPEDARDGAEVRVRVGGSGYRGRLVDASTDEPLAGLELWFEWKAGTTELRIATTDADGRFEIRGLPPSARFANTVDPEDSPAEFGTVVFEIAASPADPPQEVVLRRPRYRGGTYAGQSTVLLEGRVTGDPERVAGLRVSVAVVVPGVGVTTWTYQDARTDPDGRFRVRVGAVGDRVLSLWGGEPWGRLHHERWATAGVDPEVREFVLPPR